jgi:RES domain-containing protein
MNFHGFPRHLIAPDSHLYRIHRDGNGPWYFNNDGDFRFDLGRASGHGTCYLAENPLGAFVETLQGFRRVPIPRPELEARRLFTVEFADTLCVADLTTNEAGSFGVDNSISSGKADDYGPSQKLARELFANGFAGVRYWVRNDLAQNEKGVALFGPAGVPDVPMPVGTSEEIPQSLVHAACETLHFMVRGPLLEPA